MFRTLRYRINDLFERVPHSLPASDSPSIAPKSTMSARLRRTPRRPSFAARAKGTYLRLRALQAPPLKFVPPSKRPKK